LTRKTLIVGALALLALVGFAGGAAWALWPKATDAPAQTKAHPAAEVKAARRKPAQAASAPLVDTARAGPEPEFSPAAASAVPAPAAKASIAPAPAVKREATAEAEAPMDKLRRRLAEKLGSSGKLEASASGELRLVSHAPSEAAAKREAARGHAAMLQPAPSHRAGAHAGHWDYEGSAGPQAWGRLKPEFATCASGKRQSPIDIRDGIKVELDALQFSYKPGGFRVIDNGHTVQVNVDAGNRIVVQGRQFELLQFHFHRPSEERIDGRRFDMVVHLVHKDAEGRLAVVAVLLESGSAHAVVQSVWNNLPLEKGEEVAAQTTLDPGALVPAERSYFTYMGSLTTPPCSEGVLWMVLKNPVPISPQQIGIFARLYPMNARPVQSASGRLIKESN
jgi:carbonic anhydrase